VFAMFLCVPLRFFFLDMHSKMEVSGVCNSVLWRADDG
jgi:hypothetical protein